MPKMTIENGVLIKYEPDPDQKSATIPDEVTSIGEGAFLGCKRLTSITLPEGVTSISEGAFTDCESLTSITLPESLTSIDECAFSGCKNLTSITLPESLTSIGECAFDRCTSLTSITVPATFDLKLLLGLSLPDNIQIIRLPMETTKVVHGSQKVAPHDTTNLDNAGAAATALHNLFSEGGIPNAHLSPELVNNIVGHVYYNIQERRFTLEEYRKDTDLQGKLREDTTKALNNKKRLKLHSTPGKEGDGSSPSAGHTL